MTFGGPLRSEFSADTESDAIKRVRQNAAGLSLTCGMIGILLIVPIGAGEQSLLGLPGAIALVIGGALGVAVWVARDVEQSRRYGLWAALCTIVGWLLFWLAA